MSQPDRPRSFREAEAISARRSMLQAPHMLSLGRYVMHLREEDRGTVPDFDPLDGGDQARILFLMEKPGPMTDAARLSGRIGSGFISRDNDDPTAEAIFRFSVAAGIDRRDCLIWNAIPWWNGTRAIARREIQDGLARLAELMALLPNLQVVVAVGSKAAKARATVEAGGLAYFSSAHPSPINRAARPEAWASIPTVWAEAGKTCQTSRI